MLRKIHLHGILGDKFGETWDLDIKTPHEAAKAIGVNKPEFIKFLLESEQKGIRYHIKVGNSSLVSGKELLYPIGSNDISFIPVVAGSKNSGLMLLILGAVIVFAPYMLGVASSGASMAASATFGEMWAFGMQSMLGVSAGTASIMATMGVKLGVGLMVAGIGQMLAPSPPAPEPPTENEPNYIFNGAVNSTRQGVPIPVCYGIMNIGGATISASFDSRDQ